jgi:hypothetical protein
MDTQGYASAAEVRSALQSVYEEDPESNLQKALLRTLADELQPIDGKGRWKPSPLLVLLSLLISVLVGVFFYFTFESRR